MAFLQIPRSIFFIVSLMILASTIDAYIIDPMGLSRLSPRHNRATRNVDLSSYQVPLSNGTDSLPQPSSSLQAIILGRGTQNYTCNATVPKPTLIGARATLLDLTPILAFIPTGGPFAGSAAQQVENVLALLPGYVLGFDETVLRDDSGLDVAGRHIFDAAGVPCFYLRHIGLGVMRAKKVGDVVAPGGADVDWLMLTDKDAGSSAKEKGKRSATEDEEVEEEEAAVMERRNGDDDEEAQQEEKRTDRPQLQQVYRVNTAGGKPGPEGCGGKPEIEVPYAALYWFYGS